MTKRSSLEKVYCFKHLRKWIIYQTILSRLIAPEAKRESLDEFRFSYTFANLERTIMPASNVPMQLTP